MTSPLDEAREVESEARKALVACIKDYDIGETGYRIEQYRKAVVAAALIADREHGIEPHPIFTAAGNIIEAFHGMITMKATDADIIETMDGLIDKLGVALGVTWRAEAVGEPDLRAAREMLPSDETPCDLEITASELTGWRYDQREGELSLYLDGEEGMTLVVVPVAPIDLPILDAIRTRIAALAVPAVLRDEAPR